MSQPPLRVDLPDEGYHQRLVSCQQACPVHTDARGYVRAIAEGRFEEAYLIARGPNPFASICGRVCGAPCEAACRRGKVPRVDADGAFVANDRPISIRALKRFVCEQYGPETRGAEAVIEDLAGTVRTSARTRKRWRRCSEGGSRPVDRSGARQARGDRRRGPRGALGRARSRASGVPSHRVRDGADPCGHARVRRARVPPAARGHRGGGRGDRGPRRRDPLRGDGREDVSFANCAATTTPSSRRRGEASRALGLPGERGPGVLGGVDLLRAVALGEPLESGSNVVVIGGGNVAYDVARTVMRQAAYDTARTAALHRGDAERHAGLARDARGDAGRHGRDRRGGRGGHPAA
jgi:formate dehydrogenase (NADP+) beta subunit